MLQHHRTLAQDIASRRAPLSVAEAFEQLSPLSIGLRQKIPVLPEGARMFRIRKMAAKPQLIAAVGAPPARLAPVGRLNDHGPSVLYLADSPDTAFAEARAIDGQYSLSDWRTQRPKVALANGGLDSAFLAEHFPKDLDSPDAIRGGTEDLDVLAFFTSVFTLSLRTSPETQVISARQTVVMVVAWSCFAREVENLWVRQTMINQCWRKYLDPYRTRNNRS